MFQSILKNIRVSCFSKEPDILLMWSHYARSHGGFCLEFDINKLDPALEHFEIEYVKEPKVISVFEKPSLQSFLGHKSTDWQYEQEIRFISAKERTYVEPEAITKLFLGSNILKRTPEARNYLRRLKCYLDNFLPHLKSEIMIADLKKMSSRSPLDHITMAR